MEKLFVLLFPLSLFLIAEPLFLIPKGRKKINKRKIAVNKTDKNEVELGVKIYLSQFPQNAEIKGKQEYL